MVRPDDGGVSTSETSVSFYDTTRRNIPENSHLHSRRRKNLKSRFIRILLWNCYLGLLSFTLGLIRLSDSVMYTVTCRLLFSAVAHLEP
jgi:hypothetical protein